MRGTPGDDRPDSGPIVSGPSQVCLPFALMADQVYAKEATDNITTVLSPNSFTQ